MTGLPYRKWQCQTCGEIYDETLGCAEMNIPPGTRFDKLPEEWFCPRCGTSKQDFVLLEVQ